MMSDLRALFAASGKSTPEIATSSGVSLRTLRRYLAGGVKNPGMREVGQLAECLQRDYEVVYEAIVAVANATSSPLPSVIRGDVEVPETAFASAGSASRLISGKSMVLVPAGTFLSGANNGELWLPAFYIDKSPVTNAEYSRFVEATDHRKPSHWPEGGFSSDLRDHPVVFVNWNDATAYATWAGKALPSAQQWEKAARGPNGNIYPWGNGETPAKCNVRENGIGSTTPSDRYHSGTSPYGAYDLCGNVWEWCATQSTPGRYELKGSAFTSPFARATPALFNDASAEMQDDDTGFRCVIAVNESEAS